jgi:carbonic anhydrase
VFSANRRYAERFHDADLPTRPARRLAVLCCMDSRIDLFAVLGLRNGDAHIVRNAGGLVTEDAIRSLALSHWALGTESILVIQHTRCGLHGLDEQALRARLRDEARAEPPSFGAFADLRASVEKGVERLRESPLFAGVAVAGAVYDVDTGRLSRVA